MGLSKCLQCGELTSRADGYCSDYCKALKDVGTSMGKSGKSVKIKHYFMLGLLSVIVIVAVKFLPIPEKAALIVLGVWFAIGVIFLMAKYGQGIFYAAIYMAIIMVIFFFLVNFAVKKIRGVSMETNTNRIAVTASAVPGKPIEG